MSCDVMFEVRRDAQRCPSPLSLAPRDSRRDSQPGGRVATRLSLPREREAARDHQYIRRAYRDAIRVSQRKSTGARPPRQRCPSPLSLAPRDPRRDSQPGGRVATRLSLPREREAARDHQNIRRAYRDAIRGSQRKRTGARPPRSLPHRIVRPDSLPVRRAVARCRRVW